MHTHMHVAHNREVNDAANDDPQIHSSPRDVNKHTLC